MISCGCQAPETNMQTMLMYLLWAPCSISCLGSFLQEGPPHHALCGIIISCSSLLGFQAHLVSGTPNLILLMATHFEFIQLPTSWRCPQPTPAELSPVPSSQGSQLHNWFMGKLAGLSQVDSS